MLENLTQFSEHLFIQPMLFRVITIVVLVIAANLLIRFVLYRLELATEYTDNPWDDALINAAKRPLLLLTWVVGLAYAAGVIHKAQGIFLFDLIPSLRDIFTIFCIAWFLFRLIENVAINMRALYAQDSSKLDNTTIDALCKLSRFAVIVIAAVMVMHVLGFSVSGVLAFGGLGGIAVGFAARDLLANFFGGLTLYMDRPFVVGEVIRSPEKSIEGVVEHIGWRLTTIRSLNKTAIYVPNALFTNIVVENMTRMSNRRIHETIGLRYADIAVLPAIVEDIKGMLEAHPEIDPSATSSVYFDRFVDSALNITFSAYTLPCDATHFQQTKQEILLGVANIIAQHKAEIAFPHRMGTLHNAA